MKSRPLYVARIAAYTHIEKVAALQQTDSALEQALGKKFETDLEFYAQALLTEPSAARKAAARATNAFERTQNVARRLEHSSCVLPS